jgi:hypothetical protein
MLNQRQQGHEPHRAANEALVAEIRRELCAIAGIILN